MNSVYALMRLAVLLKEVKRSGWNKKFPPGHQCKSRKVREAESSADHTYGCVMLAWLLSDYLNVDAYKLMSMLLIHDLIEALDRDRVVITESGDKRKRLERAKKTAESRCIEIIKSIGGREGRRIAVLWREFEENKTKEAVIAHQLDKLEACLQALRYKKRGDNLDPREFVLNGAQMTRHPKLKQLLAFIESECLRIS